MDIWVVVISCMLCQSFSFLFWKWRFRESLKQCSGDLKALTSGCWAGRPVVQCNSSGIGATPCRPWGAGYTWAMHRYWRLELGGETSLLNCLKSLSCKYIWCFYFSWEDTWGWKFCVHHFRSCPYCFPKYLNCVRF